MPPHRAGHRLLIPDSSPPRTEISQLERGLRIPRIDTLAKLCACLEVDPGELMAGIKWDPGSSRRGRFKQLEREREGGVDRHAD